MVQEGRGANPVPYIWARLHDMLMRKCRALPRAPRRSTGSAMVTAAARACIGSCTCDGACAGIGTKAAEAAAAHEKRTKRDIITIGAKDRS